MTRVVWPFIAIAACARKSEVDQQKIEIVGCYSIEESRDPRYPKGDRLCLLPQGIVSVTANNHAADAFAVKWTAPEGGFRAIVPPSQTKGAHVEFLVTRAEGDKLDFRAGSDWMTVRLGARTEPEGVEALEGLRACHTCVDEAVRAQGGEGKPAGPIYSLHACKSFLRTIGAKCSALGLEKRAPADEKR